MSFIDPSLLAAGSQSAKENPADPQPPDPPFTEAAADLGDPGYAYHLDAGGPIDLSYANDEVFDVLTTVFTIENSGGSLETPGPSSAAAPTEAVPPAHSSTGKHIKLETKDSKRRSPITSADDTVGAPGGWKGKAPVINPTHQASSSASHSPILPTPAQVSSPVPDSEPEVYSDEAGVLHSELTQQQRNRISASKSRKKRTAEEHQLVANERNVSRQHDCLTGYAAQLQAEVYDLNCRLLEHRDCDCTLIRRYYAERQRRESGASRGGKGADKVDGIETYPN